jgi:predicted nuclease with TOPRIM domain
MKKLEDSNEKLKQNMAIQNGAMATLDLVAKRVQKRQEMRDMLVKLEALEAELAAARSPDVLKALRAKETALTAEMNKALKEYEVLEAEFKKLNPTDDLPESK